jgi:hypothetical protein
MCNSLGDVKNICRTTQSRSAPTQHPTQHPTASAAAALASAASSAATVGRG